MPTNPPGGPVCQSCAMPMERPEHFGTNANGSPSEEYCRYCLQGGAFTSPDVTMDQMIDKLVSFASHMNMTEDEARKLAKGVLPKLKRWRTT